MDSKKSFTLKEFFEKLDTEKKWNQKFEFKVSDIRKVIFNDPATIVIFNDGRKVVVKTNGEDEFQPEIGFAMAMMKEIFHSRGAYKKWIASWLPAEEDRQVPCYTQLLIKELDCRYTPPSIEEITNRLKKINESTNSSPHKIQH